MTNPDDGKEIDHFCTENIICPYCGYEFKDSWDFSSDSAILECDNEKCKKKFSYGRDIVVEYTTSKVDPQP